MKTLTTFAIGAALIAQATAAHAIIALPSVRTQIRREAKSEGAMKNLVRPSLRVQIKGNKANAQIYSIGRSWPMFKQSRMLQKTATFKLKSLPDGELAKPVKSGGEVWHQIYRLMTKR